jgi:nitroreductase
MKFWEVLKKRRSTRAFKKQLVEEEKLQKILEAGRISPSAHNLQDWFFVVVRDEDLKEKLVPAARQQTFLQEAAVIIVICADKRLSDQHSSVHSQDFYALQDTAIATTCMWLAAVDQGLAACWIGAFSEDQIKKVLSLPEYLAPVALLPIGYPAENPAPKPRRPLGELVKEL